MPCATVHLDVAGRVLSRWDDGATGRAPFDLSRPELRDLFLLGALGPDMGYVPGVHRLVSDLAHYIGSADLARALVNRADSSREAAYAWGWVTHVLADILIHPLVGRACGEVLYGSRDLRLNSGAHIGTHVAVEVGLDATVLSLRARIPRPPRTPLLGPREGDAMGRALGDVYGLDWRSDFLLRSHRTATFMNWRWPRALGWVTRGAWWSGQEGSPEAVPVVAPVGMAGRMGKVVIDLMGRLPDPDSSAFGMLRPHRPSSWLLNSVEEVSEEFPERFQALVQGDLDRLENHNLENGIPETSGVQHPFALRTRLLLDGLISGRLSAPGVAPAA